MSLPSSSQPRGAQQGDSGRRRADSLRVLTEAAELVADHPLDLDDLLEALAGLVRKVVEYQLFAVLLEDDADTYSIRYSIGYRPELVRSLRVRSGEGLTGHAAKSRRTVVVDDVRRDPRYLMAVDAVRSEIAVPLVARGHTVGVIDLQSPQPNAFDEEQRSLLELIASRFSLAIDAAELYRSTVEQNALLRTLAEIAQDFSQILNLRELLEAVSTPVRELVVHDAFSIYLLNAQGDELVHYFGKRYDERLQLKSLPLGRGLVGYAAAHRESVLCRDTHLDERYIAEVEGIRSEVAVPLVLHDQVIGVLDLESSRIGSFNETHLQALELLAPQIASAIENARLYEQVEANRLRMEQDLKAARQLQKRLLPRAAPIFEGIVIAARNKPAQQVSGDFYDFHSFPEECFGVLNADVSGKGAAAALYAALASGLVRNLAQIHHRPRRLLEALNDELIKTALETRFLAAVYAHWVPAGRELFIASAGQPHPIVRRGGKVEALEIGGTPLGLFQGGQYDEVRLEMQPGDLFVTASDGLQETENPAGDPYGDERLVELIGRHPDAAPDELIDLIFQDAVDFSDLHTPADDRTVIVMQFV